MCLKQLKYKNELSWRHIHHKRKLMAYVVNCWNGGRVSAKAKLVF